jgi:hypothetical protein
MRDPHRILRFALTPLLATALVAALSLSPASPIRLVAPAASAGVVPASDLMALNLRGTAQREETQPERFQYTTDLYSLATGERIGTGTHSVVAAGPLVFDVTDTFRLPAGNVVSRHRGSAVPDPDHPGFVVTGIHPDGKTIVPELGTGSYAGRTGRLRMSGWHGLTKFPGEVSFDSFFVIELDPKP